MVFTIPLRIMKPNCIPFFWSASQKLSQLFSVSDLLISVPYRFPSLKPLIFPYAVNTIPKLQLCCNNSYFALVCQVCYHGDSCFTCWLYNYLNQSRQFHSLFILHLTGRLLNHVDVYNSLYLSQTNYSCSMHTFYLKDSHDIFPGLFLQLHYILPTQHHSLSNIFAILKTSQFFLDFTSHFISRFNMIFYTT